jgi:hypothetical protein
VSIAALVLVGATTAATGTVIFGGCQVEAGSFASSYIPTAGAAVSRNAELASFTLPSPVTVGSFSHAVSVQGQAPADASTTRIAALAYTTNADYIGLYIASPSWASDAFLGSQVVATRALGGAGFSATGTRLVGYNDGNQRGIVNGLQFTSEPSGTRAVTATYVRLGTGFTGAQWIDGIVSRYCFQPDSPERCR